MHTGTYGRQAMVAISVHVSTSNVKRRDSRLIDYPAGSLFGCAAHASRDQGFGTSTIGVVPLSGVTLPLVTTTPVNIRVA